MHDAEPMCGAQGVSDLDGNLERLVERQRTFPDPLRERLSLQQLHHEERGACVLANVVERADVRVCQLRDSAGFTVEPIAELRVLCEVRRQHLDCHRAIEPRVARTIDLAHTPGPERSKNFIRAETRAGGESQGWLNYTGSNGSGMASDIAVF